MKNLTSILFVIILMTSCKSNKTTETQNTTTTTDSLNISLDESVTTSPEYTFNSVNDFYKVITDDTQQDKYLNQQVTILNGYSEELFNDDVKEYFGKSKYFNLEIRNNNGDQHISLRMNKTDFDTSNLSKFKKSIDIVDDKSEYILFDTKYSKECKFTDENDVNISDLIVFVITNYNKSDEYLDSMYSGHPSEFYSQMKWNLNKITHTKGLENFISDMKQGRFKLMYFDEFKRVINNTSDEHVITFYPNKISVTGIYIGKQNVDLKDKYDEKVLTLSDYNIYDVKIIKIEDNPIPKEFSTPGKSIDLSKFL